MKKMLWCLLLLSQISQASAQPIKDIVFFGDSLSDNGNLYQMLLHAMPKSPPYFSGRFSNGPTWAEIFANDMLGKYGVTASNYAFGGATAIYHAPSDKFATLMTLKMELDKYYLANLFKDKSKSLFVIWIGDNDYMFDNNVEVESATNKVVSAIADGLESLQSHGAKYFIMINLVDASYTPLVRDAGTVDKVRRLVARHNQKLALAVSQFMRKHAEVTVTSISMDTLFTDFIQNPEKYNQEYHVDIKNTFDACWQGGFFFNHTIAQSEYAFTHGMGRSYFEGNLPCTNPENYLFWDSIHPTAVVHSVIARYIETQYFPKLA